MVRAKLLDVSCILILHDILCKAVCFLLFLSFLFFIIFYFMNTVPLLGSCRQETSAALDTEVRNLRLAFVDVLLKHRSVAKKLQSHQVVDAKNKAALKRLRGNFSFVE